ncbi:hypothetical protein [Streptomyces sp. NPDC003077]|uniref:hypothetical protein n=1 Tax=Streptomyces sp. NPDC003077 TaxID=3154443 RepID=UPI0033ADD389
MLSARIGDRLGVPPILLPSIAATCPLFWVMSRTSAPVLLGTAPGVNAFLGLLANVQMSALRQRLVPHTHQGRVASVGVFASFGFAIPGGALGAGFLARYTGTRTVYALCALIVLVLVLAVARTMRPAAVRKAITRPSPHAP